MQAPTAIDPLEPESLPSDPREMAFRLLGMAASELKEIDKNVVSGHQSIGGLRTDINKIIHDVNTNLSTRRVEPRAEVPVQSRISNINVIDAVPLQSLPTHAQQPVQHVETVHDANQMEFDFYRKIKPEDLEYQLRCLNRSVQELESKTNQILELLKKNSINLNGNHSQ